MANLDKRIVVILGLMLLAARCGAQSSPAAPPGYSFCSNESSTCTANGVNGAVKVAYGVGGNRFVFRNFANGPVNCTNAAFGEDPDPGLAKSCYVPTDPPGYTFCSTENGQCAFDGIQTVAYGAGGHFVFLNLLNQTDWHRIGSNCSNTAFGQDPAPGVAKACFIPAPPPGYVPCSAENQSCSFSAGSSSSTGSPTSIAYGANGSFIFKSYSSSGPVSCSNATFGQDPVPGIAKSCLSSPNFATSVEGPYGYSSCSVENASCNFSGPGRVAYGASGNFIFKNFTDGAACNNSVFGEDPAPGVPKRCYIPNDPPGYAGCAMENGTCSFSGSATVAYGAGGNFIFENFTNGADCNNSVFGQDPAPGMVKSCYIPAGPTGFRLCSAEHGSCVDGSGYGVAYYGFGGAFSRVTETAKTFACDSNLGQDPTPGVVKACFVVPPYETGGYRLTGFVDLHTHPLSYLGFGGKLVYGAVDVGAMLPPESPPLLGSCDTSNVARSETEALGQENMVHG